MCTESARTNWERPTLGLVREDRFHHLRHRFYGKRASTAQGIPYWVGPLQYLAFQYNTIFIDIQSRSIPSVTERSEVRLPIRSPAGGAGCPRFR